MVGTLGAAFYVGAVIGSIAVATANVIDDNYSFLFFDWVKETSGQNLERYWPDGNSFDYAAFATRVNGRLYEGGIEGGTNVSGAYGTLVSYTFLQGDDNLYAPMKGPDIPEFGANDDPSENVSSIGPGNDEAPQSTIEFVGQPRLDMAAHSYF